MAVWRCIHCLRKPRFKSVVNARRLGCKHGLRRQKKVFIKGRTYWVDVAAPIRAKMKNIYCAGRVCEVTSVGRTARDDLIIVTKFRLMKKNEKTTRYGYIEEVLVKRKWESATIVFVDKVLPVSAKVSLISFLRLRKIDAYSSVRGRNLIVKKRKSEVLE